MALYIVEVRIKGDNPAFVVIEAESVNGAAAAVEEMINVNPANNPIADLGSYNLKAVKRPTILRVGSLREGGIIFPNHLI